MTKFYLSFKVQGHIEESERFRYHVNFRRRNKLVRLPAWVVLVLVHETLLM